MTATPMTQIKGLASRLAMAGDIVKDGRIEPIEDMEGAYQCTSPSGTYVVMPDGRCNCPDYQYRMELHKGWCKHRIAARLLEEDPGTLGHDDQQYAVAA